MILKDAIGDALINTVSVLGADAMVADVIGSVSRDYPSATVREVYWELIVENLIIRAADGHLSLPV